MAAYDAVVASSTLGELRDCVERAAGLLEETANTYDLARMFSVAVSAALCLGDERAAKRYLERATALARDTDDVQARDFSATPATSRC